MAERILKIFCWVAGIVFIQFLDGLLRLSADALRLLGFKVIDFHRMIIVEGSPGVYIGDLCLGVAPLFIFAGFILSYGDNWRNKFWFIPLGWMLILDHQCHSHYCSSISSTLRKAVVQISS
jgi:hypothetical protein